MKKFLLLTIILPTLLVVTVVLILGYFYWYIPWSQDQALREEWRQVEVTTKRLKILEEQERKLRRAWTTLPTERTRQEKLEALAGIALARYSLEDYQGAAKYWEKALERDPADSLMWYNLGNAYKNLEDFSEAEECYKKAINTHLGVNPIFYNALADLYWFKMPEKKSDVSSVYTSGLLKNPPPREKIELLKGLASYYENVGNKEMARKYYLQVLEIDPENRFAKERIESL